MRGSALLKTLPLSLPDQREASGAKHAAKHPRTTSHTRWSLTVLLFLLSAAFYLDRLNFSIAGRSILSEYGLNELQLGWIVSAFLLGYGLFQAPCGRLADRYGPRIVVAGAVCWWALFTALTTAVPHRAWSALWALIAIRFLLGAGEAIFYPACSLFTTRWIPVAERGRANGLIFAGIGIGAGVAPPLITFCLFHYGWRFSFWASAIFGLALGAIWFAAARDTPEDHPGISDPERHLIRVGIDPRGAAAVHGPSADGNTAADLRWWQTLASWNVWAITAAYFCFGYVAWLFFGWFYIYLTEERGVNLRATALYGMLPFIAMVVGSIVGGLVCDRVTVKWGVRTGRCTTSASAMAGCGSSAGYRVQDWNPGACQRGLVCWRGDALSRAKLLLVRERGHRRPILRACVRNNEHGRTGRWRRDSFTYPVDRDAFRMGTIICDRRLHGRFGLAAMAVN